MRDWPRMWGPGTPRSRAGCRALTAEPEVSKGVEVAKLMPGGFWLLNEFDGKFGEMEFHGQWTDRL